MAIFQKSKMMRALLGVSALLGPTFLSFWAIAALLSSCSSNFEGEYSDPTKVEIVDDKWNETDARTTAERMIKSALSKAWLKEFKGHHKNRPIVIVDEIENRTDEHIDTKALTEFIRDELLNSGEIRFANNERRSKILEEIKYQGSGAVAKDQAKRLCVRRFRFIFSRWYFGRHRREIGRDIGFLLISWGVFAQRLWLLVLQRNRLLLGIAA